MTNFSSSRPVLRYTFIYIDSIYNECKKVLMQETIVVFTARSPQRIIREGGSQAWVLNPARAKLCKWLLCTQNRFHQDPEFSDATEPHHSGFLLGKISGIRRSMEGHVHTRWIIEISEYARIEIPEGWKGDRNPVRYASLEDYGIDPESLDWKKIATTSTALPLVDAERGSRHHASLTIAEAKKALAAAFGVKPEAVEITIRG